MDPVHEFLPYSNHFAHGPKVCFPGLRASLHAERELAAVLPHKAALEYAMGSGWELTSKVTSEDKQISLNSVYLGWSGRIGV